MLLSGGNSLYSNRKLVQLPKPPPFQVWLRLSVTIGKGSRSKNQIMEGRGGGQAEGTLWRVLNEGITTLDLWAQFSLSIKMGEKDWPLNSLHREPITLTVFSPHPPSMLLWHSLSHSVPLSHLFPNPKAVFLKLSSNLPHSKFLKGNEYQHYWPLDSSFRDNPNKNLQSWDIVDES